MFTMSVKAEQPGVYPQSFTLIEEGSLGCDTPEAVERITDVWFSSLVSGVPVMKPKDCLNFIGGLSGIVSFERTYENEFVKLNIVKYDLWVKHPLGIVQQLVFYGYENLVEKVSIVSKGQQV
jgi:hypothetical protein